LPESVEYKWKEFLGDSRTCIFHGDLDRTLDTDDVNPDRAALRGELDCIRQQVPNRLLYSRWISLDRTGVRREVSDYLDGLRLCRRPNCLTAASTSGLTSSTSTSSRSFPETIRLTSSNSSMSSA
jgi:hypothetical protein